MASPFPINSITVEDSAYSLNLQFPAFNMSLYYDPLLGILTLNPQPATVRGGGLSGGAIAGIVVGISVGVQQFLSPIDTCPCSRSGGSGDLVDQKREGRCSSEMNTYDRFKSEIRSCII